LLISGSLSETGVKKVEVTGMQDYRGLDTVICEDRRRIQHLGQPFGGADRGHAVVVIGGKHPQRLKEIGRHQQHEQAAEQRQPRRAAPADMPKQPEADIGGDDRDRDRGEEFQAG
jgi:hypothetical protein